MPKSNQFDDVTVAQMRAKQGAKWQRYGDEVLPSFVADMDFPLAPSIHNALREQLDRHDYGYTLQMAERPLAQIFSQWAQRRYNWTVDPARIEGMVDIVQGIYLALQLYSEPGDGVLVLTPTYPPLWKAVGTMQRRLIDCDLTQGSDGFEIDFQKIRERLDHRTKMLLLCNPHNPTGRVFTLQELNQLADIVLEYDLTVVADEIHADLVYQPNQHIPFASLSPEIAARTITMTSATKSFNLGGLRFAIAIFGSEALQERFNQWPRGAIGGLNSLGILATEIAWRDCDDWLDQLVSYLEANRNYLVEQVRKRLPQVNMYTPESTYLSWLDCSSLPINRVPFEHFLEVGKVAFNQGSDFSEAGDSFVRLNFATSRDILEQIIDRTVASLPPAT